jgi:hypothetical protein
MDFLGDLGEDLVATLLYGLVGIALLGLGSLVLDLLIPGRVGEMLVHDRSRNVAIVVAAGTVALTLIVVASLITADGTLGEGLASAAGYGLIGIALLALAFVVVDLVTPGRLGHVLCDPEEQPVAWVVAAALVGVGGVIAGALS